MPVVIDKMKLNKSAHQKPFTSKPLINLSVNKIIPPLITSKNSPIVIRVMGIVKMVNIGLTILFINASTSATRMEVVMVSTFTPGNKYAEINTAKAVTIMFTRKFIRTSFLFFLFSGRK